MNYQDLEDYKDGFFKPDMLAEIENLSAALSEKEIFQYYFTTVEQLKSIDLKYFHIAFTRGRALGKARAVDKLFLSMSDSKTGTAAALSYLKRFAEEFKGEIDDSEGKEGSFSFHVTMNEKK